MNTQTFTVGQTYTATSVCDHNCKWSYTVERRTAKNVWLKALDGSDKGEVLRRGVKVFSGEEMVWPMGQYSMAPILSAG